MKKYWIIFSASLALFATSFVLYRSTKESSKQPQIALDSFIPNPEAVKVVQVSTTSGRDLKNRVLRKLYTKDRIDTFKLPKIETKFIKAMENQVVFLKHAHNENFSGLEVEVDHLEETLDIFRSSKSPEQLANALDAYQICGDGKGNVKFTGYYSPVISARRKQEGNYEHPLYLSEESKDKGLKVAFVRDIEEIRSMRMEGTAFLQFPDGEKQLVSFDGDFHTVEVTNEESNHDLTDNDSKPRKVKATYSVFTEKENVKPVGVAKVPLTTDLTIAVDETYIPLGSILLAQVPILDEKGNLIRQEYRFVLAQDVGGRIKGAGHVDLYMGEGEAAKKRIEHMNKFGKLWLLLPKQKEASKLVAQNL
jgi:membrane-bound lytic murein transglycosylase A